jgi:hypothetical protein
MKVTAIKQGYFGKLRAVGDEFEVPEGTKGSWFQPVKQKPADDKAKAKPGDKPADDLV